VSAAPAARVAVKICGLREPDHALAAAESGADLIGFVFAASKRRVTPEQARALAQGLRAARGAAAPLTVGLFVNETPERVAEIVRECGLDLVQLCGDEPPDPAALATIGCPVIRILRPTEDEAEALVARWQQAAAAADALAGPTRGPWGSRLLIGLDARHAGLYGGSGALADWAIAARLAARGPVMLAGGLAPANVAAAIATVRPWAVDVSSGVETAGAKDPALIADFIRRAAGA
jgi:phosphoribosylanthranilate isomerase